MKKTHECVDGTKITYRLPNIIEIYELQDLAGYGKKEGSGYGMIAKILKHAKPFIEVINGKNDWDECLNSRELYNDLATIALHLIDSQTEPDVKKP